VCDDLFGQNEARAACNSLGDTLSPQFYTAGDGSGTIWMDKRAVLRLQHPAAD
jgi:hypothetical protein